MDDLAICKFIAARVQNVDLPLSGHVSLTSFSSFHFRAHPTPMASKKFNLPMTSPCLFFSILHLIR